MPTRGCVRCGCSAFIKLYIAQSVCNNFWMYMYFNRLLKPEVVSGFIIHENTREFTKRQRRVRSGGRLGNLVGMEVSHCKEAMVSPRMRRWISPRSRLAAEAVPESAGFGRPRCAMAVLPSSVS